MGEYTLIKIVKSDKPGKKMMAVFRNKKTDREKVTHFGDATMSDYTKHKDDKRKGKYQSRHKKDLSTGDPTRAGFLSYYILWGKSTSRRENIAAYKRRFFPGSSRNTSPKRREQSSPKQTSNKGLQRWFAEEWVDEKGNVCGSDKNKNTKKCRPKKRITKDTPVTWSEMTSSQKRKAVAEKRKVGMGAKASPIKKKKRMSKPISPKRRNTTSPKRRNTTSPKRRNTTSPKRRNTTEAKPANPDLYAKVKEEAKRKFNVWPSAYGSGWLVKEYKRRGGTYK